MLNKFYRFGQVLVYTTLFLPLVVSGQYVFPFITPRNFLFRLFMSLGVVVITMLWINYKELRPKRSWLNIAVVVLVCSKFLSAVFGANFYNSFWSGYERMEGVVAWLFFGIFYFLIITVFRKREEWLWLFRIALVAALGVAIYGFGQVMGLDLQYGRERWRIEATLGNAAYVGAYMTIHVGMALYVMLQDRITQIRWGAGLLAIVFVASLGLTATRGAGVGFIVGTIIALLIFILFANKSYKKTRIVSVSILLAFILFSSIVVINKDSKFVKKVHILDRLASISLDSGTAKSRLYIWNMAFRGFKEKPVFGWGQDNFHYIYNQFYDTNAGEEWVDRAHNNLLDQLSMGGAVGFLSYLAVIGFPFYIFFRFRKKDILLTALLIGWWTAYVVQNQFVFDSINTYISFFILLGLAQWKSREINSDESDKKQANGIKWSSSQYNNNYNTWIAGGLLVAMLIINAAINYPGYAANKLTISALEQVNANPAKSYDYFQTALDLGSFGNKEIIMQLQVALGSYLPNPRLSDEFKTQAVKYTIQKIEDTIEREPNDARLLIFASHIYHIARVLDSTYLDKAYDVLIRAKDLSPGRAELYLKLAENSALRNDSQGVFQFTKKAYDIDSEVLHIMFRYLDLLLQGRQADEALVVANQAVDLHEESLGHEELYMVAQAYALNNKWKEVVVLGEKITKLDSSSINYWKILAAGYEKLGQSDKLVPIIEKIDALEKGQEN